MNKCSVCGVTKTTMWRFDCFKNVYCNACGIKQYRQSNKITKESQRIYKAELAFQRRRKHSIARMAAIIDKIRNDNQAKSIINILAQACEYKVSLQLAAGGEVHVDISDITKSCTFWKRLEEVVE